MKKGPVGERLRATVQALREDHDWTQKDLADHVAELLPPGVRRNANQSNISRIENGRRAMDVDTLAALAQVFRVPVARLLGLTGIPAAAPREEVEARRIGRRVLGLAEELRVALLSSLAAYEKLPGLGAQPESEAGFPPEHPAGGTAATPAPRRRAR